MTRNPTHLESEAQRMRKEIWKQLDFYQEPSECAEAGYLVCLHTSNCGFGCKFNQVIQCLSHGQREGKTTVFKNEQFLAQNKWSDFMLPLTSCQQYYDDHWQSIDDRESTIQFDSVHDDWEEHRGYVPEYAKSVVNGENMAYPTAWFLGVLSSYVMRFQPETQHFIDNRCRQKFGSQSCDDIHFDISVHVRRSDKVGHEAQKYELAQYVQEMDHLLRMSDKGDGVKRNFHNSYGENYGISVYLATDDPAVMQEALQRFPQYNWHFMEETATRTNTESVTRRLSDKEGMMELLFDIVMLSKGDYFVGTFSSNIGRIIEELFAMKYVDPAEYSLSLDSTWWGPV